MSVIDDILSIRPFNAAPLIPYLICNDANYSIGYVTVLFAEEDRNGVMIIEQIEKAAVRTGEIFDIISVEPLSEQLILNFGDAMLLKYQEYAEEYCSLIDEGHIDEAKKLFNQIACQDLIALYSRLFAEYL